MVNFLAAENIEQNIQRFEREECENGNDCYSQSVKIDNIDLK